MVADWLWQALSVMSISRRQDPLHVKCFGRLLCCLPTALHLHTKHNLSVCVSHLVQLAHFVHSEQSLLSPYTKLVTGRHTLSCLVDCHWLFTICCKFSSLPRKATKLLPPLLSALSAMLICKWLILMGITSNKLIKKGEWESPVVSLCAVPEKRIVLD